MNAKALPATPKPTIYSVKLSEKAHDAELSGHLFVIGGLYKPDPSAILNYIAQSDLYWPVNSQEDNTRIVFSAGSIEWEMFIDSMKPIKMDLATFTASYEDMGLIDNILNFNMKFVQNESRSTDEVFLFESGDCHQVMVLSEYRDALLQKHKAYDIENKGFTLDFHLVPSIYQAMEFNNGQPDDEQDALSAAFEIEDGQLLIPASATLKLFAQLDKQDYFGASPIWHDNKVVGFFMAQSSNLNYADFKDESYTLIPENE